MVDRTNVVKSEDAAPKKKAPAKKAAPKKKPVSEDTVDQPVVHFTDNNEKVLVYFESGSAYITGSGHRFSRSEPLAEVTPDEANVLLRLSNFRLPSDEEKEMYYNNQEA
jgi:hypothetical protein